MKHFKLADLLAFVLFLLTPIWTNIVGNYKPGNMTVIKEILPYLGVVGISIYFLIVHNKRMRKVELHLKAWKAIGSSRDGESVRLFRETFSEKELKQLGFTQDEANKIIGGSGGVYMAEIIPHYSKYINN